MPMMKTAHDLVLEAKQHIREISLEDALASLEAKPLVLDVREPDEFQQGHLPSAINIPRGVLEFRMSQEPTLTDRNRDILLYCKTSGRAALAADALRKLGFTAVQSVAGGFDAWLAAGLPTETPKPLTFE
jgi:rhodanese-related sulfurtransferase